MPATGTDQPDRRSKGRRDAPRVRVLGPIATSSGAGPFEPVPGHHTRATLAALVIAARHVVPVDRLIDALWEDRPPPSAAASVQAHISRLRRLLGEAAIHHEADGYALDLPCKRIDACRFERLTIAAEAAAPVDPDKAHRKARAALRLWRGPAFGDVGDAEFLYLERRRLDELRISVQTTALGVELELGKVNEAVAALQAAVDEHPYRERLWQLLAVGLARQGRRLEALDAVSRYEAVLADAGLGPDPGIERLATEISRGEVGWASPDLAAPVVLREPEVDETGRGVVEPAAGSGAELAE